MTLEERIEKLEKRRSRTDKRPLHIAYIALIIAVASGALGIVNAWAISETVRISRYEKPAEAPPPRLTPVPKTTVPMVKGRACGRYGARYFCE